MTIELPRHPSPFGLDPSLGSVYPDFHYWNALSTMETTMLVNEKMQIHY